MKYHFNTALYCDTIADENGNTVTIAHNTATMSPASPMPPGGRSRLRYDGSNRINLTDPLSRLWTLAYDASNQSANPQSAAS